MSWCHIYHSINWVMHAAGGRWASMDPFSLWWYCYVWFSQSLITKMSLNICFCIPTSKTYTDNDSYLLRGFFWGTYINRTSIIAHISRVTGLNIWYESELYWIALEGFMGIVRSVLQHGCLSFHRSWYLSSKASYSLFFYIQVCHRICLTNGINAEWCKKVYNTSIRETRPYADFWL